MDLISTWGLFHSLLLLLNLLDDNPALCAVLEPSLEKSDLLQHQFFLPNTHKSNSTSVIIQHIQLMATIINTFNTCMHACLH